MPMSVEEYRIAQLYMIQVSSFPHTTLQRLHMYLGSFHLVSLRCGAATAGHY